MSTFARQLTTEFQNFERHDRDAVVLYIYNDSDSTGDELHLESTHADNPEEPDDVATVEEYVNGDTYKDGTIVDRLEPAPIKLRIEEVSGNWRVFVGSVNHPAISYEYQ